VRPPPAEARPTRGARRARPRAAPSGPSSPRPRPPALPRAPRAARPRPPARARRGRGPQSGRRSAVRARRRVPRCGLAPAGRRRGWSEPARSRILAQRHSLTSTCQTSQSQSNGATRPPAMTETAALTGADTKAALAAELAAARARTITLLEPLSDEDLTKQHSSLMSPLVWDLAHIGVFEELWL